MNIVLSKGKYSRTNSIICGSYHTKSIVTKCCAFYQCPDNIAGASVKSPLAGVIVCGSNAIAIRDRGRWLYRVAIVPYDASTRRLRRFSLPSPLANEIFLQKIEETSDDPFLRTDQNERGAAPPLAASRRGGN